MLNSAVICREHRELLVVSDLGRILRLPVNESTLPLMGRLPGPDDDAETPGEQLIGAVTPEQSHLLLISGTGALARIDTSVLRFGQRGDLGTIAVGLKAAGDRLVGLSGSDDLAGIVTSNGRYGRFDPNSLEISQTGAEFSDQLTLQQGETITELISAIQA